MGPAKAALEATARYLAFDLVRMCHSASHTSAVDVGGVRTHRLNQTFG